MSENRMYPGRSRQESSQSETNDNEQPAEVIHNMFAKFVNKNTVDQTVDSADDLVREFLEFNKKAPHPELMRTEHKTIEKEVPYPCHNCTTKTRMFCIRCSSYTCGSCEIGSCYVPKDQVCTQCGGICTMVPDLTLKMCCSDFARSTMAFAQKMPESREKQVALNQIRDIKYCQNCINRLVAADIEGAVR